MTFQQTFMLFFFVNMFLQNISKKSTKFWENVICTFEQRCYPMTTFSGNFALFFRIIFLPKYFEKKRNVLRKCYIYFWIMVLPNDDISTELCTFF